MPFEKRENGPFEEEEGRVNLVTMAVYACDDLPLWFWVADVCVSLLLVAVIWSVRGAGP